MYDSICGSVNYAGHLESCLLKSNANRQATTRKLKSTNCKFNDLNRTATKFKAQFHKSTRPNQFTCCNTKNSSLPMCRSTQTASSNRNAIKSIHQMLRPIKLAAFNMCISVLICSLLCTSLANGQFFGSPLRPAAQPASNSLASSNSFDSPNEINSIELFVHENARAHHTIDYEIVDGINPPLVIRRADVFLIGIKFRKPYDPRRDKVRLEFMFGECFLFIC